MLAVGGEKCCSRRLKSRSLPTLVLWVIPTCRIGKASLPPNSRLVNHSDLPLKASHPPNYRPGDYSDLPLNSLPILVLWIIPICRLVKPRALPSLVLWNIPTCRLKPRSLPTLFLRIISTCCCCHNNGTKWRLWHFSFALPTSKSGSAVLPLHCSSQHSYAQFNSVQLKRTGRRGEGPRAVHLVWEKLPQLLWKQF